MAKITKEATNKAIKYLSLLRKVATAHPSLWWLETGKDKIRVIRSYLQEEKVSLEGIGTTEAELQTLEQNVEELHKKLLNRCPKCGVFSADKNGEPIRGQKNCTECGHEIGVCPHCTHTLDNQANTIKHCPFCGEAIPSEEKE